MELIEQAVESYNKALEFLGKGDVFDAAEKAWRAVENIRKALLVAVGIPYDKAKTINYGYPLFSRILRALGQKDLLEKYEWFESILHAKGFYGQIIPFDELKETILEVREWLEKMRRIIGNISKADLSDALKIMEKIMDLRRELLRANMEYTRLNDELRSLIDKKIKQR